MSKSNGRAAPPSKADKREPQAKRRRLIIHSDSESEDDYKPGEWVCLEGTNTQHTYTYTYTNIHMHTYTYKRLIQPRIVL